MTTLGRLGGAAALALALLLTSGGTALAKYSDLVAGSDEQKAAIKCFRAIIKESAKYQAAHAKLIDKCKKPVVQKNLGSLAACNPLTGDLGAKRDAAKAKLFAAIAGKCGGKDKTCGVGVGDEADIPLADINWDIGTCVPFETSGSESIAINDCGDIGPCLSAHIEFANHQVVNDNGADLFDSAIFGAAVDPGKTDNKCQQTILKEVGKFLIAKRKTLLKCWDKKAKLKADGFDDNIQCPNTDVDGKTQAAIAKIEQKIAAGICKKCGGENDGDKDGNCDVNPAGPLPFLGGPMVCPSVVVPPSDVLHRYDNDANAANGADCGAIGTIDDLQEYIDCITCVAEFKGDCLAHAANGNGDSDLGMDYPAECGVPTCGNGVIDPGEQCDTAAAAPQCANAGNGLQNCNPDCTCSCPSTVTFAGDATDPASSLDTGWTGQAHDASIIDNGLVTVQLSGCDDGVGGADDYRDPDCGVCNITGPVANPNAGAGDIDSQRCRNSKATPCTADSDCGPNGPCVFFFGAPLPLSAGGTPSCIFNEFVGAIVGTADIESGDSANAVSLISQVHLGPSADKPCANCIGDVTVNDGVKGGTCDSGARMGLTCDVMGVSPIPAFNGGVPGPGLVNGTSLDCPYVDSGNVGRLPINLSNSTGTETLTVSATGPSCTAAGFTTAPCMCDTCNTAAAEPCNSDADCPGGAAGSCGGLRCLGGVADGTVCTTAGLADPICSSQCTGFMTPDACCLGAGFGCACGQKGEPTKPNGCSSGTCTAVGGGEGECATGPFPATCSPTETFKGCSAPSDCTFPGDSCVASPLECFLDNGVIGGTISAFGSPDVPVNDTSRPTLGSAFCIQPTGASAINAAAGLPGAGRVTLTGDANGLP